MQAYTQTIFDITADVAATKTSEEFTTPPVGVLGCLLQLERVSAAPGTAAGFVMVMQANMEGVGDWRNWVRSASADFNAVSYLSLLLTPRSGILIGAFDATAPAAVGAVALVPLPKQFRLQVVRATAQSMSYRMKLHWLLG